MVLICPSFAPCVERLCMHTGSFFPGLASERFLLSVLNVDRIQFSLGRRRYMCKMFSRRLNVSLIAELLHIADTCVLLSNSFISLAQHKGVFGRKKHAALLTYASNGRYVNSSVVTMLGNENNLRKLNRICFEITQPYPRSPLQYSYFGNQKSCGETFRSQD